MGKCPGCEAWNTLEEETAAPVARGPNEARTFRLPEAKGASRPQPISEVEASQTTRQPTGMNELDRVLGGGLVPGSMILVGGDPGIGKSTILLQALDGIGRNNNKPLYVTGEESPEQVRLRADRLGVDGDKILLLSETRMDTILSAIETTKPSVVVIDSIQSVFDPAVDSAPGTVSQIREVAARLMYLAKARRVPVLLIGHVTKDGNIAGPRVLEHMVDTVLYFESSAGHDYRILRAHKNRFGSTNEIGVFEMGPRGLKEVENASELFLAERSRAAPGSVVLPALEGTRPLLVEVQALVAPAAGPPRRTCSGFDSHRAALLVAVLERRAGLQLVGSDVFVNVAGGVGLSEPAADLAVALALASSFLDRPLPPHAVAFAEVGLTGELRAVSQAETRLKESRKLGFKQAFVSKSTQSRLTSKPDLQLVSVRSIAEAVEYALA